MITTVAGSIILYISVAFAPTGQLAGSVAFLEKSECEAAHAGAIATIKSAPNMKGYTLTKCQAVPLTPEPVE